MGRKWAFPLRLFSVACHFFHFGVTKRTLIASISGRAIGGGTEMKRATGFLYALLALAVFILCLSIGKNMGRTEGTELSKGETLPAQSSAYRYTSGISAELTFIENRASCRGAVSPVGAYPAFLTVSLHQRCGKGWKRVAIWHGNAIAGNTASAGGTVAVGAGVYRVLVSANVGGGLERSVQTVMKEKEPTCSDR